MKNGTQNVYFITSFTKDANIMVPKITTDFRYDIKTKVFTIYFAIQCKKNSIKISISSFHASTQNEKVLQ